MEPEVTPDQTTTPPTAVTSTPPPAINSLRAWQQLYIEIEIRDRVFGGTVIKQKALFTALHIHQEVDSGKTNLRMLVITRNFENNNGAYGALISQDELPYRPFELLANNDCVIDLATGMPYSTRFFTVNGEPTWDELMNAVPDKQLMYQGDFFQMLQFSQDIRLTPMIEKFIRDADSDLINKFK